MNGRFLGRVDVPDRLMPRPVPFIDGDMVLAVIEGDGGIEYVKRFRLQLPEEVEQQQVNQSPL